MHDAFVVTRTCLWLFLGALMLLPLAARSSFSARVKAAAVHRPIARQIETSPWQKKNVAAARDPFLPVAYDATAAASASSITTSALTGRKVTQGDSTGYAVPSRTAQEAFVRAIVLGDQPYALIEVGEQTQLVTVGDHLLRSTVSTITSDGVRLRNGLVLRVSEQ